jgi:predicted membrane-bound spermidine synthase
LLGLIVRALLLVVCTRLGLIVCALLLIIRALLALVVAALLVRAVSLVSRTRAGVALVAAVVLCITLCRLCDRSAHTQRKCQSSDRNERFAKPHG